MPTLEEVAKQSGGERLGRMARIPDDLAAAIRGHSDAALVRRPDATNWAPNEILCHLRDIEKVDVSPENDGSPKLEYSGTFDGPPRKDGTDEALEILRGADRVRCSRTRTCV